MTRWVPTKREEKYGVGEALSSAPPGSRLLRFICEAQTLHKFVPFLGKPGVCAASTPHNSSAGAFPAPGLSPGAAAFSPFISLLGAYCPHWRRGELCRWDCPAPELVAASALGTKPAGGGGRARLFPRQRPCVAGVGMGSRRRRCRLSEPHFLLGIGLHCRAGKLLAGHYYHPP